MFRFIGRRLLLTVPVLLGVALAVFLLLHYAPGDPARVILGEMATADAVAEKRAELGLDDPLAVQFGRYIYRAVVHGDLGLSYTSGKSVTLSILERLPTTLLLTGLSILAMMLIGLPAGIISAIRQYSWVDNVSMMIALIGVSMPNFWSGLIAILFFSLHLGWFPASGFYSPIYWVLPAVTIGFNAAAILARTTRSSMLEVIRQDYIRTIRAKGQAEHTVVLRHVLKNALIPIITVIGIQFGNLLGGAMITEQIFSIPGLGKFMVEAIKARDYPIVQGGVLIIALNFTIVNLIVDILYAYVDPRIKSQFQKSKKKVPGKRRMVAANEG